MAKKFFFLFLVFFTNIALTLSKVDKWDIIPDWNSIIWANASWGTNLLDSVFEFFRESIFSLLSLVAIAVFLYIWTRLVVARWNPEELKKAWTSLIYAVIGIVLVSVAWAIVNLVAGLDF